MVAQLYKETFIFKEFSFQWKNTTSTPFLGGGVISIYSVMTECKAPNTLDYSLLSVHL